jgi:hypothetical protein
LIAPGAIVKLTRRMRRPGLADLPAAMLPALVFISAILYTAWCAWWI